MKKFLKKKSHKKWYFFLNIRLINQKKLNSNRKKFKFIINHNQVGNNNLNMTFIFKN